MIGARRTRYGEYPHQSTTLSDAIIKLGGEDYFAFIGVRPSTPTIYNVSTTTADWTAIASGLSNVLAWRLVERDGNDFYYAFTAAPTAYMTGFGFIAEDTNISQVYVKRPTTTNINMQLLVWKI